MLLRKVVPTQVRLGLSGRRMSGKRLIIGALCTVCVTLGLYLKFFNHESADELLKANRQELQAEPLLAKPIFHRLQEHKVEEDAPLQDQRAFKGQDGSAEREDERGRLRPDSHMKNGDIDTAGPEKAKEGGVGDGNEEVNDDSNHPDPLPEDTIKEQDVANVNGNTEIQVPIVEGGGGDEDEDEEDEVRKAGGDGGEGEDVEDDGGETRNSLSADGRDPHGIKVFDWNKWVKDNNFVELGNIWGYCDDPNPPVIGKVLLMPDEENGGLKNVLVFNTTLEYDVVMGKVEVSIDYNGMHFYTNTFDFSDLESESEFFKCPVVKGDHYFFREQYLSALIPKGHFYGEARMIDQNDKVIICSTMNLEMK